MKQPSTIRLRVAGRDVAAHSHRLSWRRLIGMAISAGGLMVAARQAAEAFGGTAIGIATRLLP